uniref:Rpa-associated protein n=1 Tax=uncultured Poseidoniia archaeon TaxID=1697135 RepID=A0A1B1TEG9_9ARCH|nr:rpa-associated protein [uncultured Candidatus Thalassoarchaea sp.]
MGGCFMISTTRIKRQSAIRLFAQEYSESNLTEQGVGEYDPSFVITKLGIKVNRALFCGVIDRLEKREGDNGPSFNGQIRDPTGINRFNVASFQPELQAEMEELFARFESGDRFLMAIVGKSRWFEGDEGGIFTSFRVEEFTVINQELYMNWLIDTSDATLRRLNFYEQSLELELNKETLISSGFPKDLVDGTLLARQHYSNVDTENYRLGILKALSSASGREIENNQNLTIQDEGNNVEIIEADEDVTPENIILNTIQNLDTGSGVEYDKLVEACTLSGVSRESAEDCIEDLRDVKGDIIEPRFGFFRLLK